jgi:hypothetical protein
MPFALTSVIAIAAMFQPKNLDLNERANLLSTGRKCPVKLPLRTVSFSGLLCGSPLFSVSSVLSFLRLNTEDTEKRGEMRRKPAPGGRRHLGEKKCRIAGIL